MQDGKYCNLAHAHSLLCSLNQAARASATLETLVTLKMNSSVISQLNVLYRPVTKLTSYMCMFTNCFTLKRQVPESHKQMTRSENVWNIKAVIYKGVYYIIMYKGYIYHIVHGLLYTFCVPHPSKTGFSKLMKKMTSSLS